MLGGYFSPAVCLGLPVGTDMSALGFQISLGVTPYTGPLFPPAG